MTTESHPWLCSPSSMSPNRIKPCPFDINATTVLIVWPDSNCADGLVRRCSELVTHAGVQLHDAAMGSTVDVCLAHIAKGVLANDAS